MDIEYVKALKKQQEIHNKDAYEASLFYEQQIKTASEQAINETLKEVSNNGY